MKHPEVILSYWITGQHDMSPIQLRTVGPSWASYMCVHVCVFFGGGPPFFVGLLKGRGLFREHVETRPLGAALAPPTLRKVQHRLQNVQQVRGAVWWQREAKGPGVLHHEPLAGFEGRANEHG